MLIRYKDPTHWHPFALKEGAGWILPAQGGIWRGEQSPPTAIQAFSLAADSSEVWANPVCGLPADAGIDGSRVSAHKHWAV